MDFLNQDPQGMPKSEENAKEPSAVAEESIADNAPAEAMLQGKEEENVDAAEPGAGPAAQAADIPSEVPDQTEREDADALSASSETEAAAQEEIREASGEPAPAVERSTVRYRWDYETQRAADEQHYSSRRRSGVYTYAIVMTAFFAVSFAILIAALLTGGLVGRNPGSGSGSGADRVVYVREDDGTNGLLTVQEIAEQSKPGVVAVVAQKVGGQGVGSGFILRADGYIATNYHVVENATSLQVTLYDGTAYEAHVINYSAPDDLAVLKIEAKGLPVLPIGNSDQVLVGDDVVIIGHPAGLEYGWSTTNGILSAINREVKIKNNDGTLNKKMTLLQTNANVNSGNSGGPMFNERGEVIGIISMKLADGYEGMGFAIPINGAMEIINAIIEDGSADHVDSSISEGRPLLGVSGVDVVQGYTLFLHEDGTYSAYKTGNVPENVEGESFVIERAGFFIGETQDGSDAQGKLQKGDIIIAIDGKETNNRTAMMAILNEKSIGDQVVIDYVRQGEIHSVKITLIAEK